MNSGQCLQANPPPHFVSLLVVFLGYAQTVATPPLICLLYGRISHALADGLGRLAWSSKGPCTNDVHIEGGKGLVRIGQR